MLIYHLRLLQRLRLSTDILEAAPALNGIYPVLSCACIIKEIYAEYLPSKILY
jgi:hypothetical protein